MDLSFLNNKKILITGATGIIGFNLYKIISQNKLCDIHINFKNNLSKKFDSHFKNVKKHQFDITSLKEIKNLPSFDFIFFCSGYGQPKKFTLNNKATFNLNTLSVSNLIEKVNENGKFIFISTSEIYADSNGNSEESIINLNPLNPRFSYIMGKLSGEMVLQHTNSNIECKSIRVCLCYGEGFKKTDERVMTEFISQAVNNKKISMLDSGKDLRSYIYADDCINGILNISKSSKHNLYNLGGNEIISIRNLSEKIAEITNSEIIIGSDRNKLCGSPSKAVVDISRYEKEFGLLNTTSISDGLKKCIEWYKNYE